MLQLELLSSEIRQSILFSFFRIETTGPRSRSDQRAGSTISDKGRTYARRTDDCAVYVRVASLDSFNRNIGLTMTRKRGRLKARLEPLLTS